MSSLRSTGYATPLCVVSSGSLAPVLERARMAAVGVLGSGVVHEFTNLLTIVDGARQLRSLGMEPPSPQSVDEPAQRCQRLVDAFRHVFAAPRAGGLDVNLHDELNALEPLLVARLRGRRTTLGRSGPDPVQLPGSLAVPVRLAWLCATLAELELCRAHDLYPDHIDVEIGASGPRVRTLSARFPLRPAPPLEHPANATRRSLVQAARGLAAAMGGSLARLRVESGRVLRLTVPADAAPSHS